MITYAEAVRASIEQSNDADEQGAMGGRELQQRRNDGIYVDKTALVTFSTAEVK